MGQARNLRLRCNPPRETLPAVTTSIWFWIAFHIGVFIAIGIDLFTFHQRGRELSMAAAARRSVLWVILSLGFNALVWRIKGPHHALDFFTGYLIEYSLSMDNIFVFVLIFAHFRVPPKAQHRVLVWGIIGALIMRGTMILGGIALVQRFHFILYLFGLFLLITAAQMFFGKRPAHDFAEGWVLRMCRRIPAIFAITRDPFIVYTSNICAILGLRSLYFLLAGLMNRFIYLRTGLALVLGFVGIKMILADYFPLPRAVSLGVIALILAVTIVLSMLKTKDGGAAEARK